MHLVPRIGKFYAAIKANLIGSLLNSKYAADIVMMAPEQPTEKRSHIVRNLVRSGHTKIGRRRVAGLSRKAHTIGRHKTQEAVGTRPKCDCSYVEL